MQSPTTSFDDLLNDTGSNGVDPFKSAKDQPKASPAKSHADNPAVNLIRRKIDRLFDDEPAAKQEILEAKSAPKLSKHQQFIMDLSKSGKSLAEIQRAWHKYYEELPDKEKHEVWQEFYVASARLKQQNPVPSHSPRTAIVDRNLDYEPMDEPEQGIITAPRRSGASHHRKPVKYHKPAFLEQAENDLPAEATLIGTYENGIVHEMDSRTPEAISSQIRSHVSERQTATGKKAKLTAKHHAQSLLFGLGVGTVVVIIMLFSFFNDAIIAPFIQPSRSVGATPLIIGTDGVAPSATPEVIIPKINVEIPLVGFDLTTTNEADVENALNDGVTHYPTTVLPGQKGNAAFFGHSSNNIFNPGKYKFAFALLHDIVPGDTFYITYEGKVYAYQVYDKKIVPPSDVAVLNNVPDKVATATLITCDPPGTSLNRLVVWGEQISPDPNGNTTGNNDSATVAATTQLPSNGPSLFNRLIHALF
jgi:LPXTG-site transpeptidase (sortase) family protein